jgi:very-short-patch-repair endonuclease
MSPRNDLDHRIAALAGGQHGPVSHRQLRMLGLSHEQIAYRLRVGRLIRHFPEVYLVGHTVLPREGRWMGAVLACGAKAVLSHADAAAHWGLMPSRGRLIHVTTPLRSGRDPDRTRIRLHRVGTLRAWECTLTEEIPTTTVARTLLDLSPQLRPRAMEDAIAQANRLDLFDLLAVRRCLAAHPRQHGAPALRRLLDALEGVGAADLRSTLEVLLLQLADDHDLPEPAANAQVEGFTVDFYWPASKLIVEADSYTYHAMPSAFERDRERDQQLILAGYTVVRFTHRQVTRKRKAVADRVLRLLTAERRSPGAQ